MRLIFRPSAAVNSQVLEGLYYTYYGLPATGFGLKALENGVSSTAGVLNYGMVQAHAYDRNIVANPGVQD